MTLSNRVTPLSELVADPGRGLVFGNRGCLHDAQGRIVRLAATRRWIACRPEFRGRHRGALMQPGRYTELFFLDEATAFAAGHRPCAQCRREDFARLGLRADALDARLDGERREGARRRLHGFAMRSLPDGAFVLRGAAAHLVLADTLRPWSPSGYGPPATRPGGHGWLITPPSLVELLRGGWSGAVPLFHPSVNRQR